jgi:hypothetical protein
MRFVYFLFIVFPLIGYSQSNDDLYSNSKSEMIKEKSESGNFEFNSLERSVRWVKIFEVDTNVTFNLIKDYFIKNNLLTTYNVDSNEFNSTLIPRKIDYLKYGYKSMSTPFVILRSEHKCNVRIEFKKGKYRVVLDKIEYIDDGSSDILTKSLISRYAPTSKGNIESYDGDFSFKSDGAVRTRNKIIFEILDKYLSDIFQYKKIDKKEEW